MADMFDVEPDDISVFLRQILLRSSSSSSSSSSLVAQMAGNEMQCLTATNVSLNNDHHCPVQSVSRLDRVISLVESPPGLIYPSGGVYSSSGVRFPVTPVNVSSSSVGTVEKETDEYDCESEEGLVEEAPVVKSAPPRGSSKRSRSAEVHNLSEKRRRSRINEKMKALQNLIPNSNKTDKASMLDEAIQYLKQLQLQVQMLTVRNGLSLYPLCLPGVLHQYQLPPMKIGYYEGNGSMNTNMAEVLPVDQDIPQCMPLGLPDSYTVPKQTSVANCSSMNKLVASFGWESSHDRSFQHPGSSQGIQKEKALSCRRINEDHSTSSSIAQCQRAYHFEGIATDLKENPRQACLLGREQLELGLADLEREAVMSLQMDGIGIGTDLSFDISDIV